MKPLKDWDKFGRGYRFKEKTWYSNHHLGLDIICPSWTPLIAPSDGVSRDNSFTEGGSVINFYTGDKVMRFMHLAKISKTGDVKEGEIIGYTGNSGTLTTGSHLHVDISKNKVDIYNIENFLDPETYDWGSEEYMTKDEVLDLVDKINQHIWRKLNNMESPDMSSIHKESEEYLNRYEKDEDYAFSALYNVWFENFLNEYMKKSDCNAEAEHQKYVEKNEALAKLLAEHNELKKEITSLKSQLRGKEIVLQSANDDTFAKNAEIEKLKEQLKKCEIEYTWQEHLSMAIKKLLKK